MTTIGQICSRELVLATRDTTVAEAARLMRDRHVAALVVVDASDPVKRAVGIITDRDLVLEIMAMGLDPRDVTAGEIMGASLLTAREDEDIRDALERMRNSGVRRMPVLGARDQLVGIVAADDLMKTLAADITSLATITVRERSREAAQRKPVSA